MEPHPVLTPPRTNLASLAGVHQEKTPPAPRLPAWPFLFGVILLVGSIIVAGVAMHTPAQSSSGEVPPAPQSNTRAVSVAYVDVVGGVRQLYPAAPGRVKAILAEEGAPVKKGDVLLQVDDQLAQLRLREANLAHQAAEEKLKQAKHLVSQHALKIEVQKVAIEAAQKKVAAAEAQSRKAARLYGNKVGGSRDDVETAGSLVEEAKAGVRAEQKKLTLLQMADLSLAVSEAELLIKARQEDIAKAKLGVEECKIKAPCDGSILRCFARVGEVLGSDPKIPAIQFRPAGPLIVRAEVEQEYASKVKKGARVTIADDLAAESPAWTGKVIQVSEWFTQRRLVILEPMQFNDQRTLEVLIELDPTDDPLRINQRVRVRIDGVTGAKSS